MDTLLDDIGSFPLPQSVKRKVFDEAYKLARGYIINGEDLKENEFLLKNFYEVIVDSFLRKLKTGLDVVNYPQHYDIHKQFAEPIHEAMKNGTYIVDEKHAIIPEIYVINEEAKRFYEIVGKKIALRVCVTGPLELYLREIGSTPYKDILFMFAESVRRFAKNSILNTKYVKTEVVSIDEPSFGFHEISADKNTIVGVLEKALNINADVQRHIHIHSPARILDILEVRNLDVVSIECAASPKNLGWVSKSMLEKADKYIRVGISRTDIDCITAELYERGITNPRIEQLVEDEKTMRKRFENAKERFGERMTFAGPDCGLGGWPTQEAAELLLKRTVTAVKYGFSVEKLLY
jgi:5-methyltetrahydropteroyltriglutamate--homocysteine methyltransferase